MRTVFLPDPGEVVVNGKEFHDLIISKMIIDFGEPCGMYVPKEKRVKFWAPYFPEAVLMNLDERNQVISYTGCLFSELKEIEYYGLYFLALYSENLIYDEAMKARINYVREQILISGSKLKKVILYSEKGFEIPENVVASPLI